LNGNGRRTVFFISDSTGITAETIGNSILAQFEGVTFDAHRIAFVDTPDRARAAALRIKTIYAQNDERPIVINTIVDPQLCEIIAESGALVIDVLAPFVGTLELELGTRRSGAINRRTGWWISTNTRRASTPPTTRWRMTMASTSITPRPTSCWSACRAWARHRRACTWRCTTACARPITR
jgi:hypothetical protein